MLCMIILFQRLLITRPDIRPHVKWAVSLVIADGYLIFLTGGYVWFNILTWSPLRTGQMEEFKILVAFTTNEHHQNTRQYFYTTRPRLTRVRCVLKQSSYLNFIGKDVRRLCFEIHFTLVMYVICSSFA